MNTTTSTIRRAAFSPSPPLCFDEAGCSDVGEPCSEEELGCFDRLCVEGTCQPDP